MRRSLAARAGSRGLASEWPDSRQPIALVGIGCRFPGGISDPESFWRLLRDEVDAITEVPADRFDANVLYDARPATPGRIISRWGGFLEHVDQFDAAFFGISPREAERMDPQQRLLLEVAWEAFEDAGQVPDQLVGSQTGVFVGQWLSDYEARLFRDPARVDFHMTTGSGRYSSSGRLSYTFGLEGPSLTLDTACSSSLVAVHLACQSLWSGECSLALAGGANVILQPHITIAYSQSRMIAPDGRCKFGDARANGYVRSEGAGLVLLKPLARAVADGDPIYAVIRGSAVNNDGRSNGSLTTPSQHGHEAMLRRAYEHARVAPRRVRYVEAHGTGTSVGDPVELGALGAIVGPDRPPEQPCLVGSIKTNIGHTEGAAGVAGLIKLALSLKHATIPASLHLEQRNPEIRWEDLGLTIASNSMPWPADGESRVGGVSSLGIAGTNAHVVLEEGPVSVGQVGESGDELAADGRAEVLVLSARAPEALRQLAGRYATDLAAGVGSGLRDVCYTASVRRSHHAHRLALVGRSRAELAEQLAAVHCGEPGRDVAQGRVVERAAPKIAFVFPGQGGQWTGMGRQLLAEEPVFRTALEACDQALQPYVDWSLLDTLVAGTPDDLERIDLVQPTLFAVQVALAALWQSWGVAPDAVVGHSMGEIAAAHVAGILSLAEAVRVIARRSQLLRRVSGRGAMAVVELAAEAAQAALVGYEDRLAVAVNNSPRSSVVSGDPSAVDELLARLAQQDVFCRRVKVDVASHSPQMDPLCPELAASLDGLAPRAARIRFYSTVTDASEAGIDGDAAYWVRNLRQPVQFAQAVQRLLADEHTVFVELSPHPVLLPAIEQGLRRADRTATVVPSLQRETDERTSLLHSLSTLHSLGCSIAWPQLYPIGSPVHLPTYPWQRTRFWFTSHATESGVEEDQRPVERLGHPLLGRAVSSAAHPDTSTWDIRIGTHLDRYLADHRVRGAVVLPAAAYVEMGLAAAAELHGAGSHALEQLTIRDALLVPEQDTREVQVVVAPAMPGTAGLRIFSRAPQTHDGPMSWTLHASATIRFAPSGVSAPAHSLPSQIKSRCPEVVSGEAHYQGMARRGLAYGPHFQGVTELWRRDGEALGRLRLADAEPNGSAAQVALLDVCFQVLVASAPGPWSDGTYVPVRMERVQVYDRPAPNTDLWGHAVPRHVPGESDAILEGDVFLLDGSGRVAVEVAGLRLQRLDATASGDLDGLLYGVRWELAPDPQEPAALETVSDPGSWLVLSDGSGVGGLVAKRLADHGDTCVLVLPGSGYRRVAAGQYELDPTDPVQFRHLLRDAFRDRAPCRGVVHLWSLDGEPPDRTTLASLNSACDLGVGSTVLLVQALISAGWPELPHLWLVTRGAQVAGGETGPVSIGQAPLWGLGRVIAQEHPELHCASIDLALEPQSAEIEALVRELRPVSAVAAEDQVALRSDGRYSARLVHQPVEGSARSSVVVARALGPAQPYAVEVGTPGRLDSLELRASARRRPGRGEVEIEVCTGGLNFLDVLKALGSFPGLEQGALVPLGGECAGRIVAVGPDAHELAEGDEVVAITPSFTAASCFSAFVTLPAVLVARKSPRLSFEQAATMPIGFLTARYALQHLAHLQAGERVLIHAAAGGVGLAAVQLAQRLGAEIFATAGSPAKQAYLHQLGVKHVMSSRTLAFADEVRARTGGRGVDVVLNSLAGEFIPASLAVLGPRGRFLEIGKRDIYQNSQVGLGPFKNNLALFAIDLARLLEQDQAFIGALFQETMQLVDRGELQPLPTTVFPVSGVADAFRSMAQAKHIGKIALDFQQRPKTIASSPERAIRQDGTYLITGGLSGLGLAVAEWLVRRGARHLILVGRTTTSPHAQQAVTSLERSGAHVLVAAADAAERDQLARVIGDAAQTCPPLRGVVHSAGILADATLLQLDRKRLRQVMAPKVQGAWNLHELTRDQPLDFFVMFSSVASLLGSPGQGNYAAANAFLDALAWERRRQNLPALCINWGPWSNIGLAAKQTNRGQRLALRGIGSLAAAGGLLALDRLLAIEAVQAAVMHFDTQLWCESYPSAGSSPLLTALREGAARPLRPVQRVRETLLAVRPGKGRRDILEEYVREQVARVIGLAPAQVELRQPFNTLGVDSLMALEFRNRLETGLGLSLSATLAWNYPTVALLVPHLASVMAIALEEQPVDGTSATNGQTQGDGDLESPDPALRALGQLSEHEIEAMLAGELAEVDELLHEVQV